MSKMILAATTAFLFCLADGAAAQPTTFIVDANNGPGANFTEIQPALDASAPGDLLLVRQGFYAAFTLDKGVAIVAEQFVVVDVGVVIQGVPAGQTVALQNLFLGNLAIRDCDGLVTADVLNLGPGSAVLGPQDTWVMEIRDSADVRMRQFGVNPGTGSGRDGVVVRNSRFEVDGASIDGARGAQDGGIGLRCEDGSTVHVSFGRVRGGQGLSGPAGVAIFVASGTSLAVDGTEENQVIGGTGGSCGIPNAGIFISSGATVRVSDRVRVTGGTSNCLPTAAAYAGPGTPTIATPNDLAMIVEGAIAQIGLPPRISVIGEPGAIVVFLAGAEPANVILPAFQANPLLVQVLVGIPLGTISGNGDLFVTLGPQAAPPGITTLVQCASLRTNGDLFLSNSTVAITGF